MYSRWIWLNVQYKPFPNPPEILFTDFALHSNYGFVHVFSFVFCLSLQIICFSKSRVITMLVQFQYVHCNIYFNALHNLYTFLFVARRFGQGIWYYHFLKYRQKLCIQWTDFPSLRLIAVINKSWLAIGTLSLNNFLTNAAVESVTFHVNFT